MTLPTVTNRPDVQYLKWAQKYGPVFSVKLGSQRIVVLNSAEAADELLTIRSKWYSNREPSHVGFDLVSDQQRMVHMPYDRESKVRRTYFRYLWFELTCRPLCTGSCDKPGR